MSELKDLILSIIKRPNLAGLATINKEGKPWVRYVMAVGNDDMELRCATCRNARKVKQIEDNPEVHLTLGITDPMKMGSYLQIQANAHFTTDEAERHAFWSPMLASIFDGPDDPNYGIVVMKAYRIECCTPPALEPEIWEA